MRDGGRAEGRFVAPSWFMPLRGQRISQPVRNSYKERWTDAGSPVIERFGITVTSIGQTIWLDSPDNPVNPS